MGEWSLLSEYLAFILLLVMMLFYHDGQQVLTPRRRLFWACLVLPALAIAADIATVMCDEYHELIPVEVNYGVNVLFFVLSVLMSSAIVYYLTARMLEFVNSRWHLRVVRVLVALVTVCFLALVVSNYWNGYLFYFREDGSYARGPYNSCMYFEPVIYVLLFLVCYLVNRKSVSQASTRIIRCTPLIVIPLVVVQVLYPQQLLNGIIAALVDLVSYISYQSAVAGRDALTGLQDRKSFLDELPLRAADRKGCQIIAIALRNFSSVNEVFTHRGGDALLFHIAEELRRRCGDGFVYRYNNVEFLLLMPGGSKTTCTLRLNQVRDCMDRPWKLGDSYVSVPAVLAELSLQGQQWSSEQIVNYLDYAVQLAKEESRPLVRFDARIAARLEREEHVIRAMQEALDKGGFEVWFQPIFYRATQTFQSAEALIRLSDGKGGYISPEEFVPLAERAGLIDDILWLVTERTCDLLGSGRCPWLESVSVNLSIRQLMAKDLPERIKRLLEKYDVAPERLKIEITERFVAEDEKAACLAMEKLHEAGIDFLLDDFGTGYSNFSSVLNLPFDTVKLDRSLVSGLVEDAKSRLTVAALVPFFHKLGLNVLAEGIETAAQSDIAFDFGVDRIQGFYYARPMAPEKLVDFCDAEGHRVTDRA